MQYQHLIAAALASVVLAGCASRPPAQTTRDAVQQQTTAYPETLPSGEPFAVRVLHQTYAPGQVKPSEIIRVVARPLLHKFAIDNNLTPTQEELEDFSRAMTRPKSDSNATQPIIPASLASSVVLSWKTDRELYKKYGGAVVFQQMNPQEPVGAYAAYLRECEARGEFVIADEALHEEFWAYFDGPYRMVVPPEDVDFSKPWMLKVRDARSKNSGAAKTP
jgi:hypothetical protein